MGLEQMLLEQKGATGRREGVTPPYPPPPPTNLAVPTWRGRGTSPPFLFSLQGSSFFELVQL